MEYAMIGARLQMARRALGLTQGEVATRMGMVTSTVSAIEAGKRAVTGPELDTLARLYHRPIAYFFGEAPKEQAGFAVLFRAADEAVLDRASLVAVEELNQDYAFLEDLLGIAPLDLPPDYSQFNFQTDQEAENLAEMERGRLGLGDAPIPDLMNLLDGTVGIRTFIVPVEQQSWSGLAVIADENRPCIAVNAKEESYRRNFDLAHEFAHVLVHLGRGTRALARVDKHKDKGRTSRDEHFADAFASSFLMPRRAVLARLRQTLSANGGTFTDADLVHLAMHFGVSGQAMSWRLVTLRRFSRQEHDDYWSGRVFKRIAEPLGYKLDDWQEKVGLPARYRYLATSAYEKGLISLAKLAELLREDFNDLRAKVEGTDSEHTDTRMAG